LKIIEWLCHIVHVDLVMLSSSDFFLCSQVLGTQEKVDIQDPRKQLVDHHPISCLSAVLEFYSYINIKRL
jgi:hypothetical protein